MVGGRYRRAGTRDSAEVIETNVGKLREKTVKETKERQAESMSPLTKVPVCQTFLFVSRFGRGDPPTTGPAQRKAGGALPRDGGKCQRTMPSHRIAGAHATGTCSLTRRRRQSARWNVSGRRREFRRGPSRFRPPLTRLSECVSIIKGRVR